MKRYVISGLLLLVFGGYWWHQHNESEAAVNSVASLPVPTDTPSPVDQSSPTPTNDTTTVQTTTVPTPASVSQPSPKPSPKSTGKYKDGQYTGSVADAFYGNIQVKVTISGGRITNVAFLQYPNDRRESIQINSQADPILAQEAVSAQSANVNIVSGATDSSMAFRESLANALSQAS